MTTTEKLHRSKSLRELALYFDERAAAARADAASRKAVKNRMTAAARGEVWTEAARVVRLMLPGALWDKAEKSAAARRSAPVRRSAAVDK